MATSLALAAGASAAPPSPVSAGALSDTAGAQIAALQQVKRSLTPAERKLDSQLVVAERQRTNRAVTQALPKLRSDVKVSGDGSVVVDLQVSAVSRDLLARLASVKATVVNQVPAYRALRISTPLASLTTVAGWKDVRSVSRPALSVTAHETDPSQRNAKPETKQHKADRLRAQLGDALAAATSREAAKVAAPVDQGSVVGEGDKAEAADKARTRFGITGVGVKVCALSDGVDSLAASQATGNLPDVDVLPGQASEGDEGTAMLEIIHDLAPNAALGFASANPTVAQFAQNIRDLRFVAGCDIIVDDVIYYVESPFQDAPVAQSVNAVTADGALYFSSAGNEGNTIDGTAGNYEGDFVDSGQSAGKFAGTAHDFDPGPGVQVYDPLSDESAGVPVLLFWSDPLGAAADDYDLYEFDAAGNVVAFSQDVQDGNDDPFEGFFSDIFTDRGRIAVVKFSGTDRYVKLETFRGRFENTPDGLKGYATPGFTRGHSAAVDAFSVAAAPAAGPLPFSLESGDPPNPSGPFPNPFTKAQHPERFTSQGPRRVFFQADGTPITPGNFSSTGGALRQKPDITAADGVKTSVPGFSPFFGTSAAAPHAAAIAALVLSGNPGASETLVRNAFNATALDIAPAGVDNRAGHGIVRADRVLAYTGATPQPLVVPGTPTVTVTAGDGDAYLEPGETATVALPAENVGDGRATGVSVRLVSSDPLVSVSPGSRSYGTIGVASSVTRTFTIRLAPAYPSGKKVELAATVTFAGALSPTTGKVVVPTGQPATTPTDFAYAGPPVAIPDSSATGASVSIPVGGIGYASALTFSIDGATCTAAEGSTTVGLDHTFVSDLIGTLTSPSGTTATLWSRNGGAGNNLCQVVFDDAAADPFSVVEGADAPFTGSYQPVDALGDLLSAPVDGSWTFTVSDNAAIDTGSIRAVSVHITGFLPPS